MVSVNVEIKARDADPAATAARCRALGASDEGVLEQRDTYFAGRHGRLKLRVQDGAGAELIAYRRPDDAEAEESAFIRAPADGSGGPAARRSMPRWATTVVVVKRRRLFMWEHVRIHLDDVEGLGTFIELEAMVGPGPQLAASRRREKVARLRSELAIADGALVAVGYSDLLLDGAAGAPARRRRRDADGLRAVLGVQGGRRRAGAPRAPSTPAPTSRTWPTPRASAPRRRRSARSSPPASRRSPPWPSSPRRCEVCPPCGGCRQRLAEFGSPDTPVYLGRPGSDAADDDARGAAAAVVRAQRAGAMTDAGRGAARSAWVATAGRRGPRLRPGRGGRRRERSGGGRLRGPARLPAPDGGGTPGAGGAGPDLRRPRGGAPGPRPSLRGRVDGCAARAGAGAACRRRRDPGAHQRRRARCVPRSARGG